MTTPVAETAKGSQHAESGTRWKNKIRFVTAASLFDGHDASINIMRRILQSLGAEVIHLGHNRSVGEIVDAAIQEDAQGIAVSSYQGGHMEYFKFMYDLLRERGAPQIKLFGGGGGVIVPEEIKELHDYGVTRIFSPEDGAKMGLVGMIEYMLAECDFDPTHIPLGDSGTPVNRLARQITELELGRREGATSDKRVPVVGITGTGGAGKSSLTDEIVRRFIDHYADKKMAIISVDPSKRRTGGALLGDRIRMNAVACADPSGHPQVFMRSLATRASNRATSECLVSAVELLKEAEYDLIVVETAGIGQADSEIVDLVDFSVYVMTNEYGAATQLEKIDMLDLADMVVLNKFEKRGSEDAFRDIRKQFKRNRGWFDRDDDSLPIHATIASQFNDKGTNRMFHALVKMLNEKCGLSWPLPEMARMGIPEKAPIIPGERQRYLAEITETVRGYKAWAEAQAAIARTLYQLRGSIDSLRARMQQTDLNISAADGTGQVDLSPPDYQHAIDSLEQQYQYDQAKLDPRCRKLLEAFPAAREAYRGDELVTKIRDKEIRNTLFTTSLSGTKIPKVSLPRYQDWGDQLLWLLLENVPGSFPYTAGVFPFKRQGEDPTRMFAGEGTPERTNRRFHYVSKEQPAKRLSTAFDSVTLYGDDPARRPDIYGKIGNSGVSICNLDDMKKLYSGFDLCDPKTSVSMTINGPAPIILGFYMNAAIDQQIERHLQQQGRLEAVREEWYGRYDQKGLERPYYEGMAYDATSDRGFGLGLLGIPGVETVDPETYTKISTDVFRSVRGTVQADILKEDQAQNTCIFSTEFALKLMGDVQEFFIENGVRNYYSVSISGYHIAEAGANPISQAAFTLANGFTFVEYYLSRGMDINDFAPNLSFFFSNGIDPEYAVIGRVARRIWSVAMERRYGGNSRSQKLKYHIQTSGRSLHAQEIDFNDIRTTLQALYAIYDNCNSLHTNAYDEAITTPTEASVRRAMAIQLIINRELGLAKNENPLQGAFIIEELTELVEEAILSEFNRISERGGVLSAMETQYQRGKIQEESLYYEELKHNGKLPIIGVNTFLNPNAEDTAEGSLELIRSTEDEKEQQISYLANFQKFFADRCPDHLHRVKDAAIHHRNMFRPLLEATRYCSLGQISGLLYTVGGQYRRNM
ncbi:Fused isobutyryl-CoA mutase [Sulfidibacter corallicola]|uniref:Fused isobutyryl-CoA mutase n=1 Tax=Sulfidibacter corallicola TaxID=2818388 RepID=A0A8A4TD84_SULCO|nr:methylmalonyl-CoA mutase family protein [Sulfidibacter corallicola]QTD47530.1 methylmalonyl-CoA mutase family protein [Sulfidibacter corallicola]